jgi:hypothetical protein
MYPKAPTQDRAIAPRSLLCAKLTLTVGELALAAIRAAAFCAVHAAHLRLVLVSCCWRHGDAVPRNGGVCRQLLF